MCIRRTIYRVQGVPITLAYVPGIDGHPELIDAAPPIGYEATARRIEREGA